MLLVLRNEHVVARKREPNPVLIATRELDKIADCARYTPKSRVGSSRTPRRPDRPRCDARSTTCTSRRLLT